MGRIKPRGATAKLKERITVAYTDEERIACIWAIGEIGFVQAGVDGLKAQLKNDKNPIIRLHSAIGLLKMDDDTGYDEIIGVLAHTDAALTKIAIDGLTEAGHFGVPLLSQLLTQEGPNQAKLRQTADQVNSALVAQLDAEDPELRRRAALALGQIGQATAADALQNRLADPSNQVRFSAAAALASMGQEGGINFLFAAMRDVDPILAPMPLSFSPKCRKPPAS